jgi:hypothetical protein
VIQPQEIRSTPVAATLTVEQTKLFVVALIEGVEFALDSLQEQAGFELPVPLATVSI